MVKNICMYYKSCISLLLPRFHKLPGPFEYHWLSNLGSLGSSKEIQPYILNFPILSVKTVDLSKSITLGFLITNTCMGILSDMKCTVMI